LRPGETKKKKIMGLNRKPPQIEPTSEPKDRYTPAYKNRSEPRKGRVSGPWGWCTGPGKKGSCRKPHQGKNLRREWPPPGLPKGGKKIWEIEAHFQNGRKMGKNLTYFGDSGNRSRKKTMGGQKISKWGPKKKKKGAQAQKTGAARPRMKIKSKLIGAVGKITELRGKC